MNGKPSGSVQAMRGPAGAKAVRGGQLGPDWRNRGHAGWWAFALHRISGVALSIFLPVHFFALGQALAGDNALQGFLAWTDQPLVRASEIGLVFLLAVHLAGGVRLLLVEWRGWRASSQPTLIATAFGFALLAALLFALDLL
jgi:fumarate reductase subunit D